jgi:hypothetical protein
MYIGQALIALLRVTAGTLNELACATDLSLATASRLLSTLVGHQLIQRDGDGRYRAGIRMCRRMPTACCICDSIECPTGADGGLDRADHSAKWDRTGCRVGLSAHILELPQSIPEIGALIEASEKVCELD